MQQTNGLELPALGRQARVPARRGRHNFYSMTLETAGKCSFPPAAEAASAPVSG